MPITPFNLIRETDGFDLKNENILVAGCSNTFGLGIPNEYTWGEVLKNKIVLADDFDKWPEDIAMKFGME